MSGRASAPSSPCSRLKRAEGAPYAPNLTRQVRSWRGQFACIDAAHRVHARVDDAIRHRQGLRHRQLAFQFASHEQGRVGRRLTAATLLAWLKLLVLDSRLAKPEPMTLLRILHAAARRPPKASPAQLGPT